jgi:hypothetical protein
MEGWLHEPKIKYGRRKVRYHLPAPVVPALASLGVGSLGRYMWYHEWDNYRIENGDYYIQIPNVLRVVYPLENGGPEIQAVTVLPHKGLLAAIAGIADKRLLVVNADSGHIVSDSPFSGPLLLDRLTWINDDLILGTEYGRRSRSYFIISVSQHKVIQSGDSKDGAFFSLSNGALVEADLENHVLRKLFVFPKRR